MDGKYFLWKTSHSIGKKLGLMQMPKVKIDTAESIIQEVYAKNTTFGLDEFRSNIGKENSELSVVMESFVDAFADYISEDDEDAFDALCAISKISYHLLYKAISKQMEIDEMNSDIVREAWFRYIRMSDEEKESFRNMLGLHEDDDIKDHNDPDHPFNLDLGGEG